MEWLTIANFVSKHILDFNIIENPAKSGVCAQSKLSWFMSCHCPQDLIPFMTVSMSN